MTPKEKAIKLTNKFLQYVPAEEELEWNHAKKCALICVDEILNQDYPVGKNIDQTYDIKVYWEQVKEEIEKL